MKYTNRSRQRARWLILSVLLMVGVSSLTNVASAAPGALLSRPSKAVVISAGMDGVRAAAFRPWSAEEMRAAKPAPMPAMISTDKPSVAPLLQALLRNRHACRPAMGRQRDSAGLRQLRQRNAVRMAKSGIEPACPYQRRGP